MPARAMSIIGLLVAIPLSGGCATPVGEALDYICRELDIYHTRCVVYEDLEAGGERFVPSAWMRGIGDKPLGWPEDAKRRTRLEHVAVAGRGTVMRLSWRPAQADEWFALLFVSEDGHHGDGPGHDLTGATKLTFWARGRMGKELVLFKFPAIRGKDGGNIAEEQVMAGYLSTEWQKFEVPLRKNLSQVPGGFCVAMNAAGNPDGCEIEIDEIWIDHARPNAPRLIRSYRVGQAPLKEAHHLRNAAYVYDNALAICALLASEHQDHGKRAGLIADALVQLAAAERANGQHARIRNAYACGDPFTASGRPRFPGMLDRRGGDPPPGARWLTDQYAMGFDAGNTAWTCLALLNAAEKLPDSRNRYLGMARELADWVVRECSDNAMPGYTGGYKWLPDTNSYERLTWRSAEHNIDLVSVFRRLAQAEDNAAVKLKWQNAATSAERFVNWAYDQGKGDGGRLITGTTGAPATSLDFHGGQFP